MDSKLVVEQMSGNWKIKHPDMKPLALEANRLAPFGTTYTWVPREQNKHADRLANEALDGDALRRHLPHRGRGAGLRRRAGREPGAAALDPGGGRRVPRLVAARWAGHHAGAGPARRHLAHRGEALLRRAREQQPRSHRRGTRPGARGRRVAGPDRRRPSTSSSPHPVRRTRESAEILAERLGLDMVEEPGFAEMEFGTWDGLTFAEVREQRPDEIAAWLGSLDVAPGGGESFREVEKRVLAGLSARARDVRRQDRGRGQPRDADQDPGRARRRRAADRGVPDGALDRRR